MLEQSSFASHLENASAQWLSLTPQGVLHAFSSLTPSAEQLALQTLLRGAETQNMTDWLATVDLNSQEPEQEPVLEPESLLALALDKKWIELTSSAVQAPDTRLGDFIEYVIAPLSGNRRVVLSSDSGFVLGYVGVEEQDAEVLSAAAAEFGDYAQRQSQRGFGAAGRYVSFFSDPLLLLPDWSLVPFWVDGNGYWLAIGQEPLLNNQALVELVWGICIAAERFAAV